MNTGVEAFPAIRVEQARGERNAAALVRRCQRIDAPQSATRRDELVLFSAVVVRSMPAVTDVAPPLESKVLSRGYLASLDHHSKKV
jgi:hypothetical protein